MRVIISVMPKGVEHYAAVRSDLIFTVIISVMPKSRNSSTAGSRVIISVMPKGVEHIERTSGTLESASDHLCDAERR